METREWAERILFGESLDDKLCRLESPSDDRPGKPLRAPDFPGRPAGLGRRKGRGPSTFPALHQMDEPETRGRVLHFFANHELLALELMALMLLRFPRADPSDREALVETLRDEQRHFSLYVDRMATLGVELGELPVNGFFWDIIADVPEWIDFDVRMGLTFEQANLDHALFFAQRFAEVEDDASARLMRTVLADEVRHVRDGLARFRKRKDSQQTDWQAYLERLPDGLVPSRARGKRFNAALRRSAGFDDDFIDRLEIVGHSKGRPPVVWLYNPACEAEIVQATGHMRENQRVAQLARDFATVPTFLAAREDVVCVPRVPTPSFLAELARVGFSIPQFVEAPNWPEGIGETSLGRRKIGSVAPWGWSPRAERVLAPLIARCPAPRASRLIYSQAWSAFHSKAAHVNASREWWETTAPALDPGGEWLIPPAHRSRVCDTVEAVEALTATDSPTGEWLLKSPFGVAGQGHRRVRGAFEHGQRGWVERVLRRQGSVVVEPHFERVFDFSFHYDHDAEAGLRLRGICRFLSDARGRFEGVVLSRYAFGLGTDLSRFLHGDGSDRDRLRRLAESVGASVAQRARKLGYFGPIGVDGFVYRAPTGELRLQPWVEINPRWTMGRVGVRLSRRVSSRCVAVWRQLRLADGGGRDNLLSWLAERPLALGRFGLIESGALPTNDPATAEEWIGLVVAAPSWQAIEGEFEALRSGAGAP